MQFCINIAVLMSLIIGVTAYPQTELDLVDVTNLDSTIIVEIKYATADNFMGEILYSANICLLRKPVALKLIRVNQSLRKKGYGLKVWDAYRPLAVQKKMWEKVSVPGLVANPEFGSNHNRGAAVDVTLVDSLGNELEMPTGYDDFSRKARSNYTNLTEAVLKNRKLLHDEMKAKGFIPIRSEWWHFNDSEAKRYQILDIPLKNFILKNPRN
ncbi:peptidase M15 [candidate division KSB1 bacterium]|nr:peptidase M15 [candidate division KSB1 bacterium]